MLVFKDKFLIEGVVHKNASDNITVKTSRGDLVFDIDRKISEIKSCILQKIV